MRPFKRAFVSVKRNRGKSILLLLLVAGFGILMSSAIIINQSVNQSRDNLWRQLPPLVVIDRDQEAAIESITSGIFDWESDISLTSNILDPITSLPYVLMYDIFNGTTIYSRELASIVGISH